MTRAFIWGGCTIRGTAEVLSSAYVEGDEFASVDVLGISGEWPRGFSRGRGLLGRGSVC